MQKFLRFFAAAAGLYALLLAPAQAQTYTVPNNGLETWAQRGAALAPTNWLTLDDYLAASLPIPFPITLGTVTRSTDRHSGSYAAKLETVVTSFSGDTATAILVLGAAVGNPNSGFPGGAPFVNRPQEMRFYYKLTGANAAADSALAAVVLTRYVNGAAEVVGISDPMVLTPAASYTLATLPISYTSSATPDSVRLIFTSGSIGQPHPGTALYLDDITLNGTALATRTKAESDLRVYPNPSTSGIFELNTAEAALLTAPLTVTDATGRVVLREETVRSAPTRRIDLSGRPAGIYTLQLSTGKGVVTRKLVVQ